MEKSDLKQRRVSERQKEEQESLEFQRLEVKDTVLVRDEGEDLEEEERVDYCLEDREDKG